MSLKKLSIVFAAALCCCLISACGNNAAEKVDSPAVTAPVTVDSQPETAPAETAPADTTAAETTTEETTTSDDTTTDNTTEVDTTTDDTTEVDTTEVDTSAETTTSETTVTTAESAVTEPDATTTAETTASAAVPEIAVNPMSGKMFAKSDVNVRSGAGTGFERLGHLDGGDEVEITGLSENGWYRIVFKGGEGFVSEKYLQNEKPAAVTSASTAATASKTESKQEDKPAEVSSKENYMENIKPATLCPDKYFGKKNNITYGKVERKTYYSKTTGSDRPVNIVLPANYSKDKKYPVIYVLHGIFCNENTMMDSNGTHYLIQNMMAVGECEEMIIVFPNMYAAKDKNMQPSFGDIESVKPYDDFLDDLVNDLMPYMEKNYSVATGKDNTAVFGFSMGGREALATGFTYPDKFGYVGAVAPAPGLTPGQDWAFKHPGQFKESELKFGDEKPYLLMVCAGDKDGTVGQFPKSYHNIMDKNKTEHIWWEIPGSDHGDPAIASGTYNFTKYAFKAK